MSNSSFSGPVRSKAGFVHYSVNATTGAETETTIVDTSGNLVADFTPAVETAEHAAGVIGTGAAPATYRWTEAGVIVTQIKIDLQGLASTATANDVIGLAAGGVAYIGRNVVATNGVIYAIDMACIEVPAGGDTDINLVANASATLEYDGAGGTTYGVDGGTWTAGKVVSNTTQGLTANHYFYLTAGTGSAAAYTTGQFVITMYGHALLT